MWFYFEIYWRNIACQHTIYIYLFWPLNTYNCDNYRYELRFPVCCSRSIDYYNINVCISVSAYQIKHKINMIQEIKLWISVFVEWLFYIYLVLQFTNYHNWKIYIVSITRVHTLKYSAFFTDQWYYVASPKNKSLLHLHVSHKPNMINENEAKLRWTKVEITLFHTLNIDDLLNI